MRKIIYLALVFVIIYSCKDKNADSPKETEPYIEEKLDVTTSVYPENLTKVFEAHGGIDAWNEMETLEFSVEKPGGYEITTTDLKDRYALIEMPKNTIGFDGEVLWTKSKDNAVFEGYPESYYNMMFYFYAMPFVLADDGIIYADADPLTFEGKTYSGIQISYENGVGDSSNDEYVLYYDGDSHQMAWLAYKEAKVQNDKSKEWQFINYSEWQEVEGLLLPETMVWYTVENNKPTIPNHEVEFVSPMLTTVKMDIRVYGRPEGGKLVQ